MATARDIVTRALRKRKVLSSGEDPTADELTDGLDALNDMLAAWSIDGIDFGHVTLESATVLDVPDSHLQTVVLSLSERLTDFGGSMDPMDVLAADRGRSALQAQYFSIADLTGDNPLCFRNLSTED